MLRRCGRRSHQEVAVLIDQLGGAVDAWTDQEMMGVSVETTADGAEAALSLLLDAVTSPTFDDRDVDLERQVTMAELEMLADDPVELAEEALGSAAWGEHPLARPIIGTCRGLAQLTPDRLKVHHGTLIRPGQLLMVVAGDVPADDVEQWAARLPLDDPPALPLLPPVHWRGERVGVERPAQGQFSVRFALPTPGLASRDVPSLLLLSRLLGVGASSRLFQRLREELGLVYDISSGLLLRSLAGRLEIAWSCSPEQLRRTRDEVRRELARLSSGINDDEVVTARRGIVRNLEMEFDDPSGRCGLEASELLQTGRVFDLEQASSELEVVDSRALREIAERLLDGPAMAEAWCGPRPECEQVA